jgi:hypothetical protein
MEVTCGQCGAAVTDTPEPRKPCADCGSTIRQFGVELTGHLKLESGLRAKGIDPSETGRSRVFAELRDEPSIQRTTGSRTRHERLIDRRSDHYREVVTDAETGAILHHCDEPLSRHQGHGSAKSRTK